MPDWGLRRQGRCCVGKEVDGPPLKVLCLVHVYSAYYACTIWGSLRTASNCDEDDSLSLEAFRHSRMQHHDSSWVALAWCS